LPHRPVHHQHWRLILPNTSHFAFLQDATLFNVTLLISSATASSDINKD
jgi:hypothetical protein